jgi:hypothetical protein
MALLTRAAREWTDYQVCELLGGRALLGGEGVSEEAFEDAWKRYSDHLVNLWVSGWTPGVKFVRFVAGRPLTRPEGWWRYCAPRPRRPGESQWAYLKAEGLLLVGESPTRGF